MKPLDSCQGIFALIVSNIWIIILDKEGDSGDGPSGLLPVNR
jgi:hypothetical protein